MNQQEFNAEIVADLRKLADGIESGAVSALEYNETLGVTYAPTPSGPMKKIKSGVRVITMKIMHLDNVRAATTEYHG